MATIWLHFLKQNKNCSQEFVQSTHRVHANCCYSNKYVELCSVVTEVYPANLLVRVRTEGVNIPKILYNGYNLATLFEAK